MSDHEFIDQPLWKWTFSTLQSNTNFHTEKKKRIHSLHIFDVKIDFYKKKKKKKTKSSLIYTNKTKKVKVKLRGSYVNDYKILF